MRCVPETGVTSTAAPALLSAVAEGDALAMKQCIEVHGPLVWGIVCRRAQKPLCGRGPSAGNLH